MGDENTSAPFLGARPRVGRIRRDQMLAEVEAELFGGEVDPVVIDRYRLERRIGIGGMGVVYSAWDPELGRKVALKIYAPQRTGPADLETEAQRLQREARALASFSHPNIVPVYDVGERDGELYLVMELVDGEDLRTWLGRARRSWRQVVDVFLDAGRGLEAAHARGIVHRDFKPANVLVGSDGRARVADFGLAIESARDDAGISAKSGSPAYMAPEQHAGAVADERSDQYAFCVALFEGVYGDRPFEDGDTLIAAKLRREVKHLDRGRVPGALRAAIMRGLAPDPAIRHTNLTALLTVLTRVRGASRRLYVALGVVAVGSLGVAAGARAWSTRPAPCEGAPERLAGVWDQARRHTLSKRFSEIGGSYAAQTWSLVEAALDERARQWTLAYVDACEATHVRGEQPAAALDLRMRCLDENLAELRGLVGAFAEADKEVLREATTAVHALRPVAHCNDVALLESSIPVPDAPAARAQVGLMRADLARARALGLAGQSPAGLVLIESIEPRASGLGFAPLMTELLLQRGLLRTRVGDYSAARKDLVDAYWDAAGAGHDRVAAQAAVARSCLECRPLANGEAGLEWAQHADVALSRLGSAPLLEAEQLTCSGACLARVGRSDETEARVQGAIEVLEQAGAPEARFIRPLTMLGVLAWMKKDSTTALGHFERALEIAERVRGNRHPAIALLQCNVAIEYLHQNKLEPARALYDQAHAITEAAFGPESPRVARSLVGLGRIALMRGRPSEARAHYERALAVQALALGPRHPDLLDAIVGLGDVELSAGKPAAARSFYERALGIAETAAPLDATVPDSLRKKLDALTTGSAVH